MTQETNGPYPETNLRERDANNGQDQNPTSTNLNVEPFRSHAANDLDPESAGLGRAPTKQGFARLLAGSPTRETTYISNQLSNVNIVDHPPNIVIFGEAGVGKSSVINLVAGERRADVSNNALGCTFEFKMHLVNLDGMRCALWDTMGLDEGSEGTVPAELAEGHLKSLMTRLAGSGGIHLIMYCIRATRLTRVLKRNYDLFYVTVCRKKVPVSLVVTGLEYQQGGMETWWTENEGVLRGYRMWFHAHACVTTLDANVDDATVQERRLDSQKRLRDLIVDYARRPPWRIEPSLMTLALSKLRSFFHGLASMGKRTVRRVIVYDRTTPHTTRSLSIGDLEYHWVYVDTSVLHLRLSPGVLVFYTSEVSSNGVSDEDFQSLKMFYEAARGNTCPVIVVLRGCNDEQAARRYWDTAAPHLGYIRAEYTVEDQQAVNAMVERLCIEHDEVRSWSAIWGVCMTVMYLVLWRIRRTVGSIAGMLVG